jgi:hypothetical protein
MPEGLALRIENGGESARLTLLEEGKQKPEKAVDGRHVLTGGASQGSGEKGEVGAIDDGVHIEKIERRWFVGFAHFAFFASS